MSVVLVQRPTFIEGSDAPGADAVIARMFGGPESGCYLTTKLPDNTAIHPDADAATARIDYLVSNYGSWINGVWDSSWTATINVVPPDQPMVPVKLNHTDTALKQAMANGVPIPPTWRPSADYDAQAVFIQPHGDNGRLYELYAARPPERSASGGWECGYGGRMCSLFTRPYGHWVDWQTGAAAIDPWGPDGVAEKRLWGGMATSIPYSHTLITRRDIRRGVIDHPVGVVTGSAPVDEQAHWVWPAQRRDSGSWFDMPQGTRMRLLPDWEVDPAKPWLQRLIETAWRDYGTVQVDTAQGSGMNMRMEPGGIALVPGGFVNLSAFAKALPWRSLRRIADANDSIQTLTA